MKIAIFIFTLAITLSSCKKEENTNGNTSFVPALNYDCRIEKQTFFIKDEPENKQVKEYDYDNYGRLIKITSKYFGFVNPNDSTELLYDAKSRLKFIRSSPGNDTTEIFYYDNQNRIIEAHSIDLDTANEIYYYSYQGSNKDPFEVLFNNLSLSKTSLYALEWSSGNLISSRKIEEDNIPIANPIMIEHTYDNMVNPFKQIGYSSNTLFNSLNSRNNLLEMNSIGDGSSNIISRKYSYNQHNYPITIEEITFSGDVYIRELEYSCN
ncbi:MAG: hypothetical protein RIC95_07660 [Vicingaceae bacterium]